MHGAPFDMRVLSKLGVTHTEDIVCTMTAAFLLDENSEVGLKALAVRYLGVAPAEAVPWEKAVTHGFKSDLFYSYARRDAEWTWALWALLGARLRDESLVSLFFDIEMPFQFVLRDLEMNGVLMDLSSLSTLREGLQEEIIALRLAAYKAGGIEYTQQRNLLGDMEYVAGVDIDSPMQLSSFIVDTLGIELTDQSESGHFSVDKHVLEGLEHKHEFFHCLLQYRRASKLMQMFLEKAPTFVDGDGRIRASFNNCVARTGRLSSSSPNLQQLPKKGTSHGSVRSLLVSPPGYSLLAADYAGQELRVLAEVSRDLTMIEAFILGKDLHLTMANKFFRLGIPELLLYEKNPAFEANRSKYKEPRDKSKTINFGIAYGKTAQGFAADWNITLAAAETIVDDYFKAAPRIKDAIDECKLFLDSHGYVVNLAGRRRRLETRKNHSYRQAFNFLIQGFSADLVKLAAVKVRAELRNHPEWDCRIVLQVHDELCWELRDEYVAEATIVIKRILEHTWPLSVPMVVDIKSGKNYERCK
jgi:DNA polymerase-1